MSRLSEITLSTLVPVVLSVGAIAAPAGRLHADDDPARAARGAQAGGAAQAPKAAFALPWKQNRAYKYLWLDKKTKVGESVFRFTTAKEAGRARHRLTFHRKKTQRGHTTSCEGQLWFDERGRPLSYREKSTFAMSSVQPFRGSQELRVQFDAGRVKTRYVNNGKEDTASENEHEVPRGAYLFSSLGLEQWAVFAPALLVPPPAAPGRPAPAAPGQAAPAAGKRRLQLFYPEFGQVVDIEFQRDSKPAKLRIGEKTVNARRWNFEVAAWKFRGAIWIDARGHLLQYESGPLRLVLATAP